MPHDAPLNPVDEFNTLLYLARGNFARGAFQAAYHLLEAALHSAVELKDPERITSAVALAHEIGALGWTLTRPNIRCRLAPPRRTDNPRCSAPMSTKGSPCD